MCVRQTQIKESERSKDKIRKTNLTKRNYIHAKSKRKERNQTQRK
jgi:hypothetical protein